MPLFFQQNINGLATLGVWSISEEEDFFLQEVPMQQDISNSLKRKQHLAGRYMLKVLDPNFPIQQISIAASRKPFLKDDPLHFSISHAGEYAAAIISEHGRVGVDLEMYTGRVIKVLHKFLSDSEQCLLQAHQAEEFVMETLLWSVKESVYKWYGAGGVDFKEDICIQSIQKVNESKYEIKAECMNNSLLIEGICFPAFCLTWVISSM